MCLSPSSSDDFPAAVSRALRSSVSSRSSAREHFRPGRGTKILAGEALADVRKRSTADGNGFPRRAAVCITGWQHSILPLLVRRVGIGRFVNAVKDVLPQVFLQSFLQYGRFVCSEIFQIRRDDPAAVLRPGLVGAECDAAEITPFVYGFPLVCQRPGGIDFVRAQRCNETQRGIRVVSEHIGDDGFHARLAGFLLLVQGFGHKSFPFLQGVTVWLLR